MTLNSTLRTNEHLFHSEYILIAIKNSYIGETVHFNRYWIQNYLSQQLYRFVSVFSFIRSAVRAFDSYAHKVSIFVEKAVGEKHLK